MRQCVWKEKETDFNWWNLKRLLKIEKRGRKGQNPSKENVVDNTEGCYYPTSICLTILNLLMGTCTLTALWENTEII